MRGCSYFETGCVEHCCGCEACAQKCPVGAIQMVADEEGFRYPKIDDSVCIHCGLCDRICSADGKLDRSEPFSCFGGHIADGEILAGSTSGGLFTAIAEAFLRESACVVGVEPDGVYGARHAFTTNASGLSQFRGSKYVQSVVGDAYKSVLSRLKGGERVLFSGTPCQVAGLKAYLGRWAKDGNLLTVEVICEGVPSPHFARKQCESVAAEKLGGEPVSVLRYRDKAVNRWDYQVASFSTESGLTWRTDRWFNPFWSIWLKHLMSRPSCYGCSFAGRERCADISLGDLWGVHLYCPDLYNGNRGASIAFCNTIHGEHALKVAMPRLEGRWLDVDDAIRYQKPMREPIQMSDERPAFMADLVELDYRELCRKWADRPSVKLLISKYVWGTNAQVCKRSAGCASKYTGTVEDEKGEKSNA